MAKAKPKAVTHPPEPDGSVLVTLAYPVSLKADRDLTEVRLRRVTGKDLRATSGMDPELRTLKLIELLGGLLSSDVDSIDMADISVLSAVVGNFT